MIRYDRKLLAYRIRRPHVSDATNWMIVLFVIIIIITLAVTAVVPLVGFIAASLLFGVQFEEINIFFGPRVKTINVGNVVLNIGAIPWGGNVKFCDEIQSLHSVKRLFMLISGPSLLVMMAMVAFGVPEGFQKVLNGFYQLFYGAFSPRTYGSQYLLSLCEFVRVNTLSASLGLIASKVAAFNLLPFPTLTGGMIVMTILNRIRPMSMLATERIQIFGLLILLILLVGWMLALYFFLWRILS